jgi:tetratricopeptide (TPR) repeat protein
LNANDLYFELAFLLACHPNREIRDSKKALEYAKKGCEATGWRNTGGFDALAAAYAECGNFEEAIRWAKKAAANMDGLPKEMAERRQARLKLYEQGKPYHGAEEDFNLALQYLGLGEHGNPMNREQAKPHR